MQKTHQKHRHHQPKKKKFGIFYGSISSLAVIAFIAVFYFVVLVSAKPRSILLLTQKIESILQEKFGQDNVSIDNSYLSFTNYGTLKISLSGLRILYLETDGISKKSFIIPTLDTEFSLLNILLMRFEPSKIKIANPNILLRDLHQDETAQNGDLSAIASLFATIQKGENTIEDLEIENAKLMIRGKNFQRDFLLKKSQIQLSNRSKNIFITAQNQLIIDEQDEINLSSNCQISENVICDLSLQNFSPSTVADLHPSLAILDRINTSLNTNISFSFQNNEFSDIKFKVFATSGSFEFLDFFAEKMNFANFAINGEYDHKSKTLSLSEVDSDFTDTKNPTNKPHLQMSLAVAETDNQERNLDFDIKLENVLVDEIEKFWPTTLSDNDIRKWVSEHTSGGTIKKASAKFSLVQKGEDFELKDINANANFSGMTLEYDKSFPEIKNISADANFTYKGMKITLTNGEVLQSKISEGLVEIDDFEAKNVMLKISGKTSGHAANSLQHASNDKDFMSEVAKYLNGDSKNSFEITLPLSKEITLKESYIAVNSEISGLKNEYLQGNVTVKSKKNFGSTDFVTNLELKDSEFDVNPLSMSKKSGIESELDLIVSVKNPQKIEIRNILLTKQEAQKPLEKFSGNIAFSTSPMLVTSASFKNTNFNQANYSLTYQGSENSQKIIVSGDRLNLQPFLSHKSADSKLAPELIVQISANRVDLLRNKYLRNLYLSLRCVNGLCTNGMMKTNYDKQDFINLRIDKNEEEQKRTIKGKISDIGYLAEGFGISNIVVGGNADIALEHYAAEKKPVFKGSLSIDNDITFYENETVKRFNKDTLFSQVRDKIFSSEKTTFDLVKVDFQIKDSILDIRSLVANNYKIGITSKGSINLSSNEINLKGMIVPGYIVNSLFGLGKIPLVGGVISGLLTGGEGGGLFGIRYQYDKNPKDTEGVFSTNKVAAFVPSTIQNLFE